MSQSKHEREQFDKLDKDDGSYEMYMVENDPLTYEKKNKIIDFTYQFYYATQKKDSGLVCFEELSIPASELYLAFTRSKPYQALSEQQIRGLAKAADALPYSPISLGENGSFELFYDVLSNPEQHAETLGIDANRYSQAYAASILMRTVFNSSIWVTEPGAYVASSNPYANAFAQYRHELCDNNLAHRQTGHTITGKHALLMRGDPIQRILETNSQPTSLDSLLAHTHFTPGRWSKTSGLAVQIDEHGKEIYPKDTVEYKEEYREFIRAELTQLYKHPDLHHVIATLGEISKQHNKYLLFASHPISVGQLGAIHNMRLGNVGFYDGSDSIVSAGIVEPSTLTVDKNNLGTVVHEALHLIFDLLVKNGSSPVKTPEETMALDQAILADQQHRQALDHAALNDDEKAVWGTVIDDLENTKSYFSGCTTEEQKQNVMRIEVIVRPMERLAAGNSEASIRKVMPHVWEFYRKHCRPMIEDYLRQQGHHDLITLDVPKYDVPIETQEPQRKQVQANTDRKRNTAGHSAEASAPTKSQILSEALKQHQTKFTNLLDEINALSKEKELENIQDELMRYHQTLSQAQAQFFKNPQDDAFDVFNNTCQTESLKLEAQLQAKSSVWHDRVYPIIKQILGFNLAIAATLISFGLFLIVMKRSPQIQKTYNDTFFKEPAINKVKQSLQGIKQEIKEVNDDVKHQSKPN
jgi:hypothetical protein